MNKYESPVMRISFFSSDEVLAASNSVTQETTKQHVTGAGGGIVLPDDEF